VRLGHAGEGERVLDPRLGQRALLRAFREKLTLPLARSMSFPSWRRSLSLAVIDTTRAPRRENSAMMVRERSSSGPVITTASPVSRSR